jgi:hypothetical protein
MKIGILLVLSLLLAVGPAVPQALDDALIVPGVRIGKWTLQMTIDDLVRSNGPARSAFFTKGHAPEADAIRDFSQYDWESLGIAAITFDGHGIEVLAAGVGAALRSHKTDKGIGFQSDRGAVLKAYGTPTAVTLPEQGQTNLIYDEIGVAFRLFNGGRVRIIYVFRPGTARRFWQCLVVC